MGTVVWTASTVAGPPIQKAPLKSARLPPVIRLAEGAETRGTLNTSRSFSRRTHGLVVGLGSRRIAGKRQRVVEFREHGKVSFCRETAGVSRHPLISEGATDGHDEAKTLEATACVGPS
jgi:hypothetical protein